MKEFDVLEELSTAIQAAAVTVCFLHPGYCSAELMVADITLWCLDNQVLEDIAEEEFSFAERVWWLMAIGLKLIRAGIQEHDNHKLGVRVAD